jgi:hypothetical protein
MDRSKGKAKRKDPRPNPKEFDLTSPFPVEALCSDKPTSWGTTFMKYIPLLVVLGFALSLCNLTNKFKSSNSNGPGTSSSGGGSDVKAEQGKANAAQAAAVAGGKEAKWERQGMTFSVPATWSETTNESKELVWSAPGSKANLIVSISPMDENFPTDVSLNAYFDSAKSQAKNGEVDEVKWVEIDGLKGVQFREANPEKPDDFRRMHWMTYRKFAGQVQYINVMLASDGQNFPIHQDAMYGILYSLKITH